MPSAKHRAWRSAEKARATQAEVATEVVAAMSAATTVAVSAMVTAVPNGARVLKWAATTTATPALMPPALKASPAATAAAAIGSRSWTTATPLQSGAIGAIAANARTAMQSAWSVKNAKSVA